MPAGLDSRLSATVYPRAYGGTRVAWIERTSNLGLSPRVRGNRYANCQTTHSGRSIPARTGEPAARPSPTPLVRVYPRAYGGTTAASPSIWPMYGLSPRVRGNLRQLQIWGANGRSIPARTGEPQNM